MQADDVILDMSENSSPSPSASTATAPSHSNSGSSRRPPRKSTLTQQQKNQKRQRATQDQLLTLELEFSKNPTPTAAVRERIAQEINMTERSVQIWFQNRRAKIKNHAKRSTETGEDCDGIPESMRQLLAMQALESGKPFPRALLGRGPMGPYGSGGMALNSDPNGSGKAVIHYFTCRSLSVGSWRRVGQNTMDLVIFYCPDTATVTYYINNDSAGYKIEFPFGIIKNISLETGEPNPNQLGMPPRPAGLIIELSSPPNFFMDSSGSGGFYQCGDFTEDQQATQVLVHHLGGHPKVLSGQLAKLMSLESFQNRHYPFSVHTAPASAPVSPTMGIIPRPASQPSVHFARPQPHVGMYQENHFGISHLHPGRPAGHKRQRSRSVPVAIDFSILHSPMPTFQLQQPSPTYAPDPHIFQPLPQHPSQVQTPLGPDLRIDTSSGYAMDFRQYPMSATATSPSEYGTPGFSFTSAPANPMPSTDFGTPYNMPYLSPSPMMDSSHMIPQSVSPLSQMGHADPVIADQSPPHMGLHRSASADIFNLSQHEHSALSDDGLMLSDMYSKQNLNLTMPSPNMDDGSLLATHEIFEYHTPREPFDMPMMSCGTINPNSMNPEGHR